jgi:hypothetical protein
METYHIDANKNSYIISVSEEGFATAPLCVCHSHSDTVSYVRQANEFFKKLKTHNEVSWKALPTLIDLRPQEVKTDYSKKYHDLILQFQRIEGLLSKHADDRRTAKVVLREVQQILADQR